MNACSVLLVSTFAAIFALIIKLWIDLDFNRAVINHRPGTCEYVDGIESGSHGIFVLSNGIALITSGIHVHAPGVPYVAKNSHVYLYDLNKPKEKVQPLRLVLQNANSNYAAFDTESFRPGDITCLENAGRTVVYIVNSKKREICIFELNIAGKTLTYIKSLSDQRLTNPNDLVALSENELYISNFAHYTNPIAMNVELALQMSLGSVFYFNGSNFEEVLDGLNCPDGLALSLNKLFLYVSLFSGQKILFYQINKDKSLKEIMQIPINSKLDNLFVDRMDRLWIGAHRVLYQGLLHMQNPERFKSPSQVLRVTFNRKGGNFVEEVFADDGNILQFASSTAVYKNILLIGTLYDKALWCQLQDYHCKHPNFC